MKAINTQEDLAMCQKIVIPEEDRYNNQIKKDLEKAKIWNENIKV